jgi:hypothetical protein
VTTNGDAKKEEVVEEETKAEPEAEEPAKESDETVEEAAGKYSFFESSKLLAKFMQFQLNYAKSRFFQIPLEL